MNYIIFELKRSIFSKKFIFAFIIGILSLFIGGFEFYFTDIVGATYTFIYSFDLGTMSIFMFLAPIISALLFSDSYLHEFESDFISNIYIRLTKFKYLTIKFFTNCISGGLIMFSITMIYSVFILVIKDINPLDKLSLNIGGAFLNIYDKNQIFCLMILVLGCSLFGAVISSISIALSPLIKNRYLTIIIPFAIFLFSAIFLYDYKFINLQNIYSFRLAENVSIIYRVYYSTFLIIASYFLFLLNSYLMESKHDT